MQESPLIQAISEFREERPDARVEMSGDGSAIIQIDYLLDGEHEGIRLAEQFELQIHVPASFPQEVPTVIETTNIIPSDYEHTYVDQSLCLGARVELLRILQADPSLNSFLEGPVQSALYTALFWQRYHRYPYGDRAHGIEGVLQAYRDLFDLETIEDTFPLMEYVAQGNYRGHQPCPCGSGLRIRNCHGPILLEMIDGPLQEAVTQDVKDMQYLIADHMRQKQILSALARQWKP